MARKSIKPSVGQRWFVRNKGAAALQIVDLLDRCGGDVWQLQASDIIAARPYHAQAGVDFKFVRQVPTPASQEKP